MCGWLKNDKKNTQQGRLFGEKHRHLTLNFHHTFLSIMYRKKINELAITLEKINYLYRTIRKSEQPPKKVELALLKKYVLDLYDGFIEMEMPSTTADVSTTIQETPVTVSEIPVAVVVETPIIKLAEPPIVTLVETPPVAVVIEKTAVDIADIAVPDPTSDVDKNSGILSNLKEKVADLQDDMAHLKANLNDTYQHAVNALQGDDTEKTPYKENLDMIDDDDDESSVKTQILEDKRPLNLPVSLLTTDDDDDETIAIPIKETTPSHKETSALIDLLGKGDSNRLEFPISFNQRHAFVTKLFSGNETAYAHAINDLSVSKGYIEALTYINLNLRYDFKWRDDEPAVKEFLDIIKHTFWG